MSSREDFLFRGGLSDLDPAVAQLIELEKERQVRKLIMIPSESSAPWAVREAIGSVLMNVYAEGYPNPDTRWLTEDEILDYGYYLAHYRRYGDRECRHGHLAQHAGTQGSTVRTGAGLRAGVSGGRGSQPGDATDAR